MASPPNFANLCFKCKKSDHWYKDCPENAKRLSISSSESSSSSSFSLMEVPVIQCPCGKGSCNIFISHTKKNPDRKFYSCCDNSNKCGFFKWVDEVVEFGAPLCPCGAGACSLNRDESGCWFFACRIKKGHGACPFFQWADSRVNSKMNKHLRRSTRCFSSQDVKSNNQIISTLHSEEDETTKRDLVMKETESSDHQVLGTLHSEEDKEPLWNLVRPVMDFPNDQVCDTSHSEEDDEAPLWDLVKPEMDFSNDQVLDTLHSEEELPIKDLIMLEREVSNHQVLNILYSGDDVPSEDVVLHETNPSHFLNLKKVYCVSYIVCQSENLPKSVTCMQISARGDVLNQDVILQNIVLQVRGWLGVFPSFDPIGLPDYATLSVVEASSTLANDHENSEAIIKPPQNPRKDAQLSSGVSGDHPRCQNRNTRLNDSASSSIFKNFGQGLLNVLEDENLVDHEKMLTIAETTFVALRSLSINISSFSKHVIKYIDCKSRLASFEKSMHKGSSSQELKNIFNSKEACLHRIARQHTERKAEYEAIESHFRSLCEEFSCMKDGSHNLQEDLERSQAKTLELKTSILKLECEMSLSKRSMAVARQKMIEAIDMEKERKCLQHEARTALESAKGELSSESYICVNRSLLAPVKNVKYAAFYVYALVPLVAFALYRVGVLFLRI